MIRINIMGKSNSRCSGGTFTSPCYAPHSHLLSLHKRSRISSLTPLLRRKMITRTFSMWLGLFLLASTFLAEIGCTYGAANPPNLTMSTSTTTDLPSILDRVVSTHTHHKCYVCLPSDRGSSEAQGILALFKGDGGEQRVPDCAGFDASKNRKAFEFRCPIGYRGCLLRIHGANISRSCAQFEFNDCKVANSKELCFCKGALCNGVRENISPQVASSSGQQQTSESSSSELTSEERSRGTLVEEQEESESRKFWQKGETDDEDLLEMADDTGSSGDGPYPPGVIDAYITTPKPTLVPNLRGDKIKTTPAPPSGVPTFTASSATISSSLFLFFGFYYYLC